MKRSKKYIIIIVILLILGRLLYLNITCPIKGVYSYDKKESITLRFVNGYYIFKGEGNYYDELVRLFGNYRRCDFDVKDKNIPIYNPIKTSQTFYFKDDKGFKCSIYVTSDGILELRLRGTSSFYRFTKIDD